MPSDAPHSAGGDAGTADRAGTAPVHVPPPPVQPAPPRVVIPAPPPFVRTNAERLPNAEIVTAAREERLDPLRGRITILLTSVLALTLILHTSLTFWASYGKEDAAKNVAAVFNIWVPIISGLVSSAVTWFFTRQK